MNPQYPTGFDSSIGLGQPTGPDPWTAGGRGEPLSLAPGGVLTGGDVLPGFKLTVDDIFSSSATFTGPELAGVLGPMPLAIFSEQWFRFGLQQTHGTIETAPAMTVLTRPVRFGHTSIVKRWE